MEDQDTKLQEETTDTSTENQTRTRVGFPQVREEKKGKGKIIFIILAILALLAVGAWLIFGKDKEEIIENEVEPTKYEESQIPTPTEYKIEKEGIKIQVLNGSGISGAAGDLKEEIEKMGYSEVSVGNASDQDYVSSEVIFSSGVDKGIIDEITDKLKEIYEDVNKESGDSGEYDIKIITGYPKDYSPTPTVKAASTSTPTPVATNTPTPTP